MTYQSGSAVASYILDISQPRQAAAELRALFQSIQQGAVGPGAPIALPAPDPAASAGLQAYMQTLRSVAPAAQAATDPLQQFVADIRAQGVALGKTEEQINAHLAALSREALAVGDVTRALALEDAALGVTGQAEEAATAQTLTRSRAQAAALVAARDYQGAIRLLATDLQNQGERTVSVINAERQLIQIENQAARAAEQTARAVQQQADAELRLAQNEARAQAARGDRSGALQTLISAQRGITGASASASASLETQIATMERGSTITGAFGQQLSGLLGPAALVATGFAAARGAIESFGEAFKFKAAFDETNLSIKTLLSGVRDTNQVIDQARAFADRYKLTQQETSEAISESIPVIRSSKASIDDILSVFTRLTILKPGKTFNDASRAIAELQSGNAVSLERIFNVPVDKANQLKKEIREGADAIDVLNKFLADSGVGAAALENRAKGAAGAMRDQARAAEELKLAQADFGAGPGTAIIQTQTTLLTGLTRLLRGDLVTGLQAATTNWIAASAAQLAYGNALNHGKTQTEAQAEAQAAYNNALNHSAQTSDNAIRAQNAYSSARQHGATVAQAQAAAEATIPPVVDQSATAYTAAAIAAQYYSDASQHAAQRAIADMQGQQQQLALTGGAYGAYAQAATAAYAPVIQGAQAAQQSAEASVADAAAKDLAQAKTALLNDQTNKAATAFIALHPAMTATEAYAAAVAQGLGELAAKVIAFRIEANKAKADLTGATSVDKGEREFSSAAELAGVAADAAAGRQEAYRNQVLRTGTELEKLKLRQDQYNEAVARYGARSEQAIDAQTDVIAAQHAYDESLKKHGRTRVDAAKSTALQLNNVEENSQLQLARTQREGLERLRDQQEDFDVRRARSKEDSDRKIRGLLARGQIAEARRARDDFARDQRREQEDFDRQRRRTLRNNAEGVGDINNRTDLRTSQIQDRAALRGVRTGGSVGGGSVASVATADTNAPAGGPRVIQVNMPMVLTTPDGQVLATITYPFIAAKLDDDLSIELRGATPPGGNQTAVAGARP